VIKLRSYQEQCLTDLARHRAEKPDETRLAVVMATGLGKTITFAAEADRWLLDGGWSSDGRACRVLILVHTEELTSQAEAKVRLVVGDRWTVGVVKAERNEVQADIVIGSVQTLANPARRAQLADVGHIIVDECHHAIAPAYRAILKHYGATCICWNSPDSAEGPLRECPDHGDGSVPPTTVTGYTATLERGDGNSLGSIWQDVAFSRSISWAVRKGFLVPPRAYRVEVPDLQIRPDVVVAAASLDRALVDSIAPERIVDAWLDHAKGRSTVLFAPLVRSARAFAAAFDEAGVEARTIHGDMPVNQRQANLRAYEAGHIEVLCNAMVLTEGWDSPRTECVIVARPTKSRPLFVQMAGRGLRPWLEATKPREDQDCILLVVADATTELASMADLSDRPIEAKDGASLLALEDEFDLSTDLAPDVEHAYDGKLHVSEFDPLVARSSKVWQRTAGGTWFIPAGDKQWVFLAQEDGAWSVMVVIPAMGHRHAPGVPDLELAMSVAEDAATDLGGNLTALYADKSRAWRKAVPSGEMQDYAARLGLFDEMGQILTSRKGGKAGRLSDLIDRTVASRRIDPVVARIRGRA
jgi:superfamily II DNA or RNA helicase